MRYSPDEPFDWKAFWKKLEGDDDDGGFVDWEYERQRDEEMEADNE